MHCNASAAVNVSPAALLGAWGGPVSAPRSELLQSAIPAEHHDRLSYRTVTADEAYNLTGYRHAGWVVAYTDHKGKPYTDSKGKPFYRLKPAQPVPTKDGDEARYLSPAGSGCRPYISPLLPKLKREIDITEGEKKTDCANVHGFPTIGLGGVSAWQDKRNGASQPLPELEALLRDPDHRRLTARVCFDSDVVTKDTVRGQLRSLSEWLRGECARVLITQLPHALDGTRWGLDDLMAAAGADAYRELRRIARPAFSAPTGRDKAPEFSWDPEPEKTHHKAVMAWVAMKPTIAVRVGHGLYQWTGTHWQLQPGRPADGLLRRLHRWMDYMDWQNRSAAAMGAIRAEVEARLTHEGQWDAPHLIAFSNGTLDTRNGAFACRHDPAHFLTACLPFPYDTSAKCPRWLEFLGSALVGGFEVVEILRAAFRWSIRPKGPGDRWLEKAFDCEGQKASGKGTTADVLHALVGGDDGAAILRPAQISNPTTLFNLKGKRVALDPDSSGHIGDVGLFNSVISNETVQIKRLYHDPIDTRLGVVVWRFFNDQPTVGSGAREGMDRRFIPFRFERKGRIDPHLKAAVLAELPGVFQWAWTIGEAEMYRLIDHAGDVAAIQHAAIENALDRNAALRFLVETFPDGCPYITATDLYKRFRDWCADNGLRDWSSTLFGREIKKVGTAHSTRAKSARWYLIDPMDQFDMSAFLGITDPAEVTGSPQPVTDPSPNPSPPEPLRPGASQSLVTGMTGFSPKVDDTREKQERERAIRGTKGSNPSHPSPDHGPPLRSTAAQSVSKSVTGDGFDPPTRHPTPIAVDGQLGWTLPGVLPKGDAPNNNVSVVDPKGVSRLIARRRITLPTASRTA